MVATIFPRRCTRMVRHALQRPEAAYKGFKLSASVFRDHRASWHLPLGQGPEEASAWSVRDKLWTQISLKADLRSHSVVHFLSTPETPGLE